jgi:two-component system CheB/CheR fusion protein
VAIRRSSSSKPGDGADESAGRAVSGVGHDDDRAAAPLEPTRLIVGIGASAGGLDAFRAFFARMPADTGMAFVLVQHLDPNYESSLVAIVGGYTGMTVHLAEDGVAVCPNQVYIIPPDAILTISDGILRLTRPAAPAARRTSINTFLVSLAQDQGENAVGIILSGFGSDGALGVVAIKEHGGLTLSQAEFDHHAKSGMPQSAASSGFVDHVLSVDEMPAALLDYQRHRKRSDSVKGPDGVRQDLATHLVTICAVLQSRLGRDFSQYKPGTLMRRIQRRMQVLQTDEVPSYIEQLRSQPNEAELLFRELLIGVTRFFRDAAAFEALETKVIPGMLADLSRSDPLRVWVAGCATGEEAYSIAILLKEGLARSGNRRPVQIFATDVDDRAIQAARAGLYLASIASDLSAERLERNFIQEDSSYRVTKDIRELCLFSTHDLVKDPPFSRLDLVSCRNLMIYFEPRLQHRVLTTFHYALRPGGHLFLGPSESITAQARLFAPLDNRHRLFARRDTAATFPALSLSRSPGRFPPARRGVADNDIDRRAARVIARYAPAFLVIDRQYDILRFSGQIAKYFEPATGVASLNLFTLLHTALRPAARAALSRAAATGTRVLHDNLSIEAGEHYATVNLIVEPLPDPESEGLFVLAFQEVGEIPKGIAGETGDAATGPSNGELLATRERLRNISEELEAANEELQSSNEEYLSVNEELQSANEELETSKEELQSLN